MEVLVLLECPSELSSCSSSANGPNFREERGWKAVKYSVPTIKMEQGNRAGVERWVKGMGVECEREGKGKGERVRTA